jgi:hypothetical protein
MQSKAAVEERFRLDIAMDTHAFTHAEEVYPIGWCRCTLSLAPKRRKSGFMRHREDERKPRFDRKSMYSPVSTRKFKVDPPLKLSDSDMGILILRIDLGTNPSCCCATSGTSITGFDIYLWLYCQEMPCRRA